MLMLPFFVVPFRFLVVPFRFLSTQVRQNACKSAGRSLSCACRRKPFGGIMQGRSYNGGVAATKEKFMPPP